MRRRGKEQVFEWNYFKLLKDWIVVLSQLANNRGLNQAKYLIDINVMMKQKTLYLYDHCTSKISMSVQKYIDILKTDH